MIFRRMKELEQDNERLQRLVRAFEEDVKRLEAEKQAGLKSFKEKLEKDLMDAHRRNEHHRDMEAEKYKAVLETQYQERVTEFQQKFFKEMKELFEKKVDALEKTYQRLIENLI